MKEKVVMAKLVVNRIHQNLRLNVARLKNQPRIQILLAILVDFCTRLVFKSRHYGKCLKQRALRLRLWLSLTLANMTVHHDLPVNALRHRRYYLLAALCCVVFFVIAWPASPPPEEHHIRALEAAPTPAPNNKSQVVSPPNRVTSPVNTRLYNHRRAHVSHECQARHGTERWEAMLEAGPAAQGSRYSPIVSTKHNLLYCPVGKVGSTYFTRYMISLDQPGPMKSPYSIPITKAGRERCSSLASLGNKKNDFLKKSLKLVVGRNPFSRIFSAYIDKVFSPNPFYWKHWGVPAHTLTKTKSQTACASGVTFSIFVKYVIKQLVKDDVHLRPVFQECSMCSVVYDVIATLETVSDDVEFVTSAVNASVAFLHQSTYQRDAHLDAIVDAVESPFSWKNGFKACNFTLDQMAMRIWRKLQIRGIIDSRISYPYKKGDIEGMPASTFIAECHRAMDKSTDQKQLKKQKTQAFLEAYSTVPLSNMGDIVKVYRDDFSAFDYNPEPPDLLADRKKIKKTDFLNWKKDWKL